MGVEDPESARELTRNVEIEEVDDLDIRLIVHMVQVVVSKEWRKEKSGIGIHEQERIEIQSGSGRSCGVAGRRQKEKRNHSRGGRDRRSSRHGMWGERES